MALQITTNGRRVANRLIAIQSLVCIVCAATYYLLVDKSAALSSLMGAIACVVPNWYFASKVFATSGASRARIILRSFYIGQVIKVLITIGVICTGLALFNDDPTPMLLTFILGLMVYRVVPLLNNKPLKSI